MWLILQGVLCLIVLCLVILLLSSWPIRLYMKEMQSVNERPERQADSYDYLFDVYGDISMK